MYAGRVVEEAGVIELFKDPKHPYTIELMKSKPSLEGGVKRLDVIPGSVPNPLDMPEGCAFHPRCSYAMEKCKKYVPELKSIDTGRKSSLLAI